MSQLDFLCSQGNYFFLIYSSLLTFYYLNRTLFSKFIFIFYFNFISFGESNKKLNFILFFLFNIIISLFFLFKSFHFIFFNFISFLLVFLLTFFLNSKTTLTLSHGK